MSTGSCRREEKQRCRLRQDPDKAVGPQSMGLLEATHIAQPFLQLCVSHLRNKLIGNRAGYSFQGPDTCKKIESPMGEFALHPPSPRNPSSTDLDGTRVPLFAVVLVPITPRKLDPLTMTVCNRKFQSRCRHLPQRPTPQQGI